MGRALHRLPERRRQGEAVISQDLVGPPAIEAAAALLDGVVLRTPLVQLGSPDERVFLKAESLQAIGAFKIRGAYVAIAALSPEDRSRGVITYSSGNHAQGVARAARLLGTTAVIVMPDDAPMIKRDRVAADGAEIVIVGPASDERQARAESIAAERGLAIIPPFDDDRIIAGQGTIGLEIVQDLPTTGLVLVITLYLLATPEARLAYARTFGWSASSPSSRPMPAIRWQRDRSSVGRPPTSRGRSPTARGPRHLAP